MQSEAYKRELLQIKLDLEENSHVRQKESGATNELEENLTPITLVKNCYREKMGASPIVLGGSG